LELWFGVEFNLTLLAKDAADRYYSLDDHPLADASMQSVGELNGIRRFSLHDDWSRFRLSLSFTPATGLWRFPVETVSQSEDGFERTYQGSCILAHWKIRIESEATTELEIGLEMRR